MKTIPLSKAIELLESAKAVIVDNSYVTFANTDNDYYFLCLAQDEASVQSGLEECFEAADNETVKVTEDGQLLLENTLGDHSCITLLAKFDINKELHEQ